MVNVEKMARHSAPEDTRKKNEHRASVLRALLKKVNKCSQGRSSASSMPKGRLVENTLELRFQPPGQADGFNKANGYLHQWEDHMGLFLAPGIGMGKGMIEMTEILSVCVWGGVTL